MKNTRNLVRIVLLVAFTAATRSDSPGWGWDAHRFINRKTVYHLPGQMQLFIQDSAFFAQHAADADQRRQSGDTSFYGEGPRHFLDIDDYPGFQTLPRSLDTLVALYGWERVKANGTNPWATVWVYDSLVAQLSRGAWPEALLSASDLGHYVGDAHQPLHVTRNYNGQFTGNYGIHSRYETTMLSATYYLSQLVMEPGNAAEVESPLEFAFSYILHANSLVDTILHADTHARSVSGWNGSGTPPPAYYAALWERTRRVTLEQMQSATLDLASLWYSAWVDAGLILPAGVESPPPLAEAEISLLQNYPNPFNPTTTLTYILPVGGSVTVTIFTVNGQEVARPVNGLQSAGRHTVTFDGSGLAAGVYFCRLQLGRLAATRPLLLVK